MLSKHVTAFLAVFVITWSSIVPCVYTQETGFVSICKVDQGEFTILPEVWYQIFTRIKYDMPGLCTHQSSAQNFFIIIITGVSHFEQLKRFFSNSCMHQ